MAGNYSSSAEVQGQPAGQVDVEIPGLASQRQMCSCAAMALTWCLAHVNGSDSDHQELVLPHRVRLRTRSRKCNLPTVQSGSLQTTERASLWRVLLQVT